MEAAIEDGLVGGWGGYYGAWGGGGFGGSEWEGTAGRSDPLEEGRARPGVPGGGRGGRRCESRRQARCDGGQLLVRGAELDAARDSAGAEVRAGAWIQQLLLELGV